MGTHSLHMLVARPCWRTVYSSIDSCLDSQNLRVFENQQFAWPLGADSGGWGGRGEGSVYCGRSSMFVVHEYSAVSRKGVLCYHRLPDGQQICESRPNSRKSSTVLRLAWGWAFSASVVDKSWKVTAVCYGVMRIGLWKSLSMAKFDERTPGNTVNCTEASEANWETVIIGTYACSSRHENQPRISCWSCSGKVHLTRGCPKWLTLSELDLKIVHVAIYSQCTVNVKSSQSQQKAEKPQKIGKALKLQGLVHAEIVCGDHRYIHFVTLCVSGLVFPRVGKRQPMVAK